MKFQEIKSRLSKFRVGIAGAGGLGSNCAVALARSGIGTIVIADFDTVEERNLNRQFYFTDQLGMFKSEAIKKNLALVNAGTEVITHQIRLSAENIPVIFKGCDVIVEAFDDAEMKSVIIETVRKNLPGIPLIAGSGMAGWGNSNILKVEKVDDTLYICGDQENEVSENSPPLAPRVGIVAYMQANTVLELLLSGKK
jgi:sulfur carrier protein ThiS adenylyltransferase